MDGVAQGEADPHRVVEGVFLHQVFGKTSREFRDPIGRRRPPVPEEDGALELYNLKEDIGERHNLAKAKPVKVKELHNLLVGWRKETGAPVPRKGNPDFDDVAEARAIRKALAEQGG